MGASHNENDQSIPGSYTEAALRLLLDSGATAETLWCIAPSLETSFAIAGSAREASSVPISDRIRRTIRDRAAEGRRRRRAGVAAIEEVVVAWDTQNQHRILAPLIDSLSGKAGTRILRWGRRRGRSGGLGRDYERRGGMVPVRLDQAFADTTSIERLIDRARASISLTGESLQRFAPRVVVLASQQSVLARAFALLGERDAVTVYLPHAPMADAPWYLDLPFHRAGLRGPGEVDFVKPLVTQPSSVHDVGNPSIESVQIADHLDIGKVVLALSPASDRELDAIFEMVLRSGLDPIVAPHPRQRRAGLRRRLPGGWRLSAAQSTDDILATGPGALVQRSSGVGLEAMRRGIPVIDIRLDRSPPTYLYLRSPEVLTAHDGATLSESLDRARTIAADREARQKLVNVAAHWSGPSGTDSVARCVELIKEAGSQSGASQPLLLDKWTELRSKSRP